MTGQLDLLVSARGFDLPPKWDGRIVKWDGWNPDRLNICPSPSPDACLACGGTSRALVNRGTFYPLKGDTHTSLVEVAAKRTGRTYLKDRKFPTKPYARFVAVRCPDCMTDTVHDATTNTWWTLDADDYGPDGSAA